MSVEMNKIAPFETISDETKTINDVYFCSNVYSYNVYY